MKENFKFLSLTPSEVLNFIEVFSDHQEDKKEIFNLKGVNIVDKLNLFKLVGGDK